MKADSNNNESDVENLIVIKQTKYLLRAVSIENGNEKWNIRLINYKQLCSENFLKNE